MYESINSQVLYYDIIYTDDSWKFYINYFKYVLFISLLAYLSSILILL